MPLFRWRTSHGRLLSSPTVVLAIVTAVAAVATAVEAVLQFRPITVGTSAPTVAIVKDNPPADPARTMHENFRREVSTVVSTEGRSRRVIWIVVAVVVVAVVAVVAYLLLYNGNGDTGTGGGGGGGGGYLVVALSMSQTRWIGRKLRSIRA